MNEQASHLIRNLLLFFLSLTSLNHLLAQELVNNGSFESYSTPSFGLNPSVSNLYHWNAANCNPPPTASFSNPWIYYRGGAANGHYSVPTGGTYNLNDLNGDAIVQLIYSWPNPSSTSFDWSVISTTLNNPLQAGIANFELDLARVQNWTQKGVYEFKAKAILYNSVQGCSDPDQIVLLEVTPPTIGQWTHYNIPINIPASKDLYYDKVRLFITVNGTYTNQTTTTQLFVDDVSITQCRVPSITISSDQNSICEGTLVHFSSIISDAGNSPSYQWFVNGIAVSGANSSTFSSSQLSDNDAVTCEVTNNFCNPSNSTTSNQIQINVTPIPVPSISIYPPTNICLGEDATFSAVVTNQGPNPVYQWLVNGVDQGINALFFTSSAIQDGDFITCQLVSDAECVESATVFTTIVANVRSASVAIDGLAHICNDPLATLTANASGSSPFQYSWNNGSTTQQINNLNSGLYSVTITDNYGCTASNSVQVTANPASYGLNIEYLQKRHARIQGNTASSRDEWAYFGHSVDIDGNFAIVGAYQDDSDANGTNSLSNAGAAYLFEFDGTNWVQIQKLVPSDRSSGDFFGTSVAITTNLSEGFLVIGAPGSDRTTTDEGAAYIFERNVLTGEWLEVRKLEIILGYQNDNFGQAVAIDGDNVVISAPNHSFDENGTNSRSNAGAAYTYNRFLDPFNGGWGLKNKIVANDRANNDRFGNAVDISGNNLIIGAYYKNSQQGAAYIFSYNGSIWGQQTKLVGTDPQNQDFFGYSVAISGLDALVGAPRQDYDHNANYSNYLGDAGAVFFFQQGIGNIWGLEEKVVASNRTIDDYFGLSVSIDGDYAIVSSHLHDLVAGQDAGICYIYNLDVNGWNEFQQIEASDPDVYDHFGSDIAISKGNIIVGARNDEHDENSANPMNTSGSVYFYEANCDCDLDITIQGSYVQPCRSNGVVSVTSVTGGLPPYSYTWHHTNATTSNISGLGPGNYHVTVTDANGCTITDYGSVLAPACEGLTMAREISGLNGLSKTENVETVLDISSHQNVNDILVYPNPTQGKVRVEFPELFENFEIRITNTSGQLVKSQSYTNSKSINIEITHPPGVYFVTIVNDKIPVTKKIIKL